MARLPRVHDQHGFTIVEVVVAATILVIGVLGVVTMVDGANAQTTSSRAREGGTNLARELIEQTRLLAYPKAGQDRIATELQGVPDLADSDSGAAGWQVQRRGTTYTVAVESCLMDDPNDGIGEHDGTFCAGAGASGTNDDNPRDYRRVTFNLNWTARGINREVRQATVLTPRGTADLPRVTSFSVVSPTTYSGTADAPIFTGSATSINFRATTSTPAAGISWLVEGVPRGVTSNAAGLSSWDWSWNIASLVDGPYTVSAQPFDSSGAAGTASQKDVILNRFVPAAPTPVYMGWSIPPSGASSTGARDIDVEWIASREKDVLGYRVYRRVSNTNTNAVLPDTRVVCPGGDTLATYTTKLSCPHEFALPSGYNEASYWVRAVDKTGATNVLREGTASPVRGIYVDPKVAGNKTPDSITQNVVTLARGTGTAAGTTSLTWPAVTDSDSGTSTSTVCNQPAGTVDCVLMYRIYRDGVRYGSTPYETPRPAGSTRTFVDANTGTGTHCYTVVAVDTFMRTSGAGNSTCG